MSRVLLAGASGFLGTALAAHLSGQGVTVRRLVRRAPTGVGEFIWDPTHGEADEQAFDDVDAVVNLCGAGVFDRPWTAARREVLRASRIGPARTLARILARRAAAGRGRPTLVQGSAIGWYGVEPSAQPHIETDPAGTDFLAELCRDWEAAIAPAADAGLRVVIARTSIVMDRSGSALRLLRVPFSVGLGAVLGTGSQHMSLISLRDWLAAVDWMIDTPDVSGPVNLTIPTVTTNAEFSRFLGTRLQRTVRITAPEGLLRRVLGPMADQLFGDVHAVPQVLTDHGFTFADPMCDAVLATALTRTDGARGRAAA